MPLCFSIINTCNWSIRSTRLTIFDWPTLNTSATLAILPWEGKEYDQI